LEKKQQPLECLETLRRIIAKDSQSDPLEKVACLNDFLGKPQEEQNALLGMYVYHFPKEAKKRRRIPEETSFDVEEEAPKKKKTKLHSKDVLLIGPLQEEEEEEEEEEKEEIESRPQRFQQLVLVKKDLIVSLGDYVVVQLLEDSSEKDAIGCVEEILLDKKGNETVTLRWCFHASELAAEIDLEEFDIDEEDYIVSTAIQEDFDPLFIEKVLGKHPSELPGHGLLHTSLVYNYEKEQLSDAFQGKNMSETEMTTLERHLRDCLAATQNLKKTTTFWKHAIHVLLTPMSDIGIPSAKNEMQSSSLLNLLEKDSANIHLRELEKEEWEMTKCACCSFVRLCSFEIQGLPQKEEEESKGQTKGIGRQCASRVQRLLQFFQRMEKFSNEYNAKQGKLHPERVKTMLEHLL
jgi:hypothetical protein